MAEVERVTMTPVDWGTFVKGKILAISTGKNHRCTVSESRLLLFSMSGVLLTDVKLGEEIDEVIDASANSSNVAVFCTTHGSRRGKKTTLTFVSGSQVLKVQEVPPVKNKGNTKRGSLVCLRVGCVDVAIFSLGTGQLFGCTLDCATCLTETLWDFGDASVRGLVHGCRPLEVVVLLDDGTVGVVALCATAKGIEGCRLVHHLQLSSTANPTWAVYAGRCMLWILCDDYSLCGYWFSPPVNEEETLPMRVFDKRLPLPEDTENIEKVFMAGDARTRGVHIAIQTPTAVLLRALTTNFQGEPHQQPPQMEWSCSAFLWSGHIHSFSFRQYSYELLVQSQLGRSPLSVVFLRPNSSVLVFEESQHRSLSHQVVCAAPEKLAGLREQCEFGVQGLEAMTTKVLDLQSIERVFSQLLDMQHSLMATLYRERELNKDVLPYQSISMHLIRRLHVTYIQLSVYRFLYTVGAGDKLDVPLREALGLEEARHTATLGQRDLHLQFEQALEVTLSSTIETLSMWGSQDTAPVMCIDAILSYIGCTDQGSLRNVVQQMTTVGPVTALLVLYCTFRGTELYTSLQLDTTRKEFLDSFCLPASVDMWAYLAFVADHHLSPPHLVVAHGAGCPPLLDLVPGLINGLTFSGAYELVFQLTGCVLSLTTREGMDPSVAVKLLFLAYKRGNAPVLQALYRRSRGTLWGNVATHALAKAAVETGSMKLLSGLITPHSPEENIVESVLLRYLDTCRSDVQLMDFYVLMQRYADALNICEKISSRHSVDAQRLQIVASHLRSLMPNGNRSYCPHQGVKQADIVRTITVPPLAARFRGHPPPPHASAPATSNCPLQNEEQDLEEAVARTTARICARRQDEKPLDVIGSGSHPRELGAVTFTPTPAASLGIGRDRPRTASQRGESVAAQQQLVSSPSVRRGDEREEVLGVSSQTQVGRNMATAGAMLSLDQDPLYCEAVLKRSKKPCGRKRPCEYHDRVRK